MKSFKQRHAEYISNYMPISFAMPASIGLVLAAITCVGLDQKDNAILAWFSWGLYSLILFYAFVLSLIKK